MSALPTAADLARWTAAHTPQTFYDALGGYDVDEMPSWQGCRGCRAPWPCPTVRLLTAYTQLVEAGTAVATWDDHHLICEPGCIAFGFGERMDALRALLPAAGEGGMT